METPLHIASCSFGKDSIATILLAMIHNEPIDRIVSIEVMFDNKKNISGEMPEHINWVRNYAIPKLNELLPNVPIDIIRTQTDFIKLFTRRCGNNAKNKDRIGQMRGWIIPNHCAMNSEGKMKEIRKYYSSFDQPIIQYVGIAADEKKRLARIEGTNKISLLEKYNLTEKDAYDLCVLYNLLSPQYRSGTRNGCWFCPNMRMKQRCIFRKEHPELWNRMKELNDLYKDEIIARYYTFNKSFDQIEKEMDFMDRQQKLNFDQ